MDSRTKRDLKHFFTGASLTLFAALIVYIIFFSNILTTIAGVQNYKYAGDIPEEPETSVETGTLFEIDDTNIILTPNLPKGTVGRYNPQIDDTIKIEGGRSLKEIKETCEHELVHNYGAEHRDDGTDDWIYQVDDRMNSKICIRFIYELGKYQG